MAFATVEEVRTLSTLEGVRVLEDTRIEDYIARANAYLRRYTGQDYREATDADLLIELKRATILLVEWIWFNDQPEVKESNMAGLDSERIGTYSYNKGEKKSQPTGNLELDQILQGLRVVVGFNLFSVSGPSDAKPKYDNPHAYVTGYWRDEDED